MSDAQTIWKLGLALGCAWGAWWMSKCSGVSDDSKTSDVRNGVAGGDILYRVPNRRLAGGANPMKGKNGTAYRTKPGTNILEVDFAHYRAVRDMRRRLDELGVFTSAHDGKVK